MCSRSFCGNQRCKLQSRTWNGSLMKLFAGLEIGKPSKLPSKNLRPDAKSQPTAEAPQTKCIGKDVDESNQEVGCCIVCPLHEVREANTCNTGQGDNSCQEDPAWPKDAKQGTGWSQLVSLRYIWKITISKSIAWHGNICKLNHTNLFRLWDHQAVVHPKYVQAQRPGRVEIRLPGFAALPILSFEICLPNFGNSYVMWKLASTLINCIQKMF